MPSSGIWRAEFDLVNQTLPFLFRIDHLDSTFNLVLLNGEEELPSRQITYIGDSVKIDLPVFDSWLMVKLSEKSMSGEWVNNSRKDKNRILFTATPGHQQRFDMDIGPGFNITGKWETGFFSPHDREVRITKAIGLFEQSGGYVTGTFLTETGDYRFLEGITDGRNLRLSSFDGAHAYLFHATYLNGRLEGEFWSGLHSYKKWVAERNDNATLTDPGTITELNKNVPVAFTFPDLNGNPVSLNDPRYKGKVVIVQIMGSWCPNCMDETAFLTELHGKYKTNGLEIIALAFEKSSDHHVAAQRVKKLKDHYKADYQFLIAGTASKEEASARLPFLNGVKSFPTTIFIDKKGKVAAVHSGFTGPATGGYYRNFKDNTEAFVAKLLGLKDA